MLTVFGAAAVALMATDALPAEPPAPQHALFARIETSLYGAFGQIGVRTSVDDGGRTNDTDNAYELRGFGLGALASLSLNPFHDSQPVGGVLLLGVTSEYRALRALHCTDCVAPSDRFAGGSMLGARLGVAYEDRDIGVRGGLLWQGGSVELAKTGIFPDVALRLGPRDVLNLSLGLGAYDALTIVRPGAYVGLSGSPLHALTLGVHFGWHCDIGSCGVAFSQMDPRLDLSAEYALSPSLRASLGGAVDFTPANHDVYEGRVGLSVTFESLLSFRRWWRFTAHRPSPRRARRAFFVLREQFGAVRRGTRVAPRVDRLARRNTQFA